MPERVFAGPVVHGANVWWLRLSIWRISRTVFDQAVMSGALQVGLIILTTEKIHSATRTSSAVPHLLPLGV